MVKVNENKQLDAVLIPVVAFNKLVLSTVESVLNLQIASAQAYAGLSLQSLHAGLEVRNVEDFTAYTQQQKDVAGKVAEQVTQDVKAVGELNVKFVEDARTLTEKNIRQHTVKAA